ncbi:unnamed protein product [Macrosiphum euphorbiae]|uniref:Uncharacterized protein n=1 Tax=Macrosiphum euphorbiae TaxID=13131 RepID=A0AAV0W3C9_9HEMI|nr:unnamed protein product [Macrosiphum euphorbiae]
MCPSITVLIPKIPDRDPLIGEKVDLARSAVSTIMPPQTNPKNSERKHSNGKLMCAPGQSNNFELPIFISRRMDGEGQTLEHP